MPRILLIDDEKLTLRIRAGLLKTYGYEVVATHSGSEAIAIFSQEHFDLVITDWLMPKITGLDIARALRTEQTSVPIIMLAGWKQSINEDQLKQAGIQHLLIKPCGDEQLLQLIEEILGVTSYQYYQLQQAA